MKVQRCYINIKWVQITQSHWRFQSLFYLFIYLVWLIFLLVFSLNPFNLIVLDGMGAPLNEEKCKKKIKKAIHVLKAELN